MMKLFVRIALFMLHLFGSDGFIIPDELPSILSIIYSNIPTLKKGTDSRIGWGFRLGDRADFQVLMELGPQTNTQPLANQGEGGGTAKRNTLNTVANTLYAQIQEGKKGDSVKTNANSPGGKWLENWSNNIVANSGPLEKEQQQQQEIPPNAKPGIAIGEIDAKSVIPEDSPVENIEKRKFVADSLLSKAANQAELKRTTTIRSLLSILTQSNKSAQ